MRSKSNMDIYNTYPIINMNITTSEHDNNGIKSFKPFNMNKSVTRDTLVNRQYRLLEEDYWVANQFMLKAIREMDVALLEILLDYYQIGKENITLKDRIALYYLTKKPVDTPVKIY